MENGFCLENGSATGNVIGGDAARQHGRRLAAERRRGRRRQQHGLLQHAPRHEGRPGRRDRREPQPGREQRDHRRQGGRGRRRRRPRRQRQRELDRGELDPRQPESGDRAGERREQRPGRSNSWLGVRGRRSDHRPGHVRLPERARVHDRRVPEPVMRSGGEGTTWVGAFNVDSFGDGSQPFTSPVLTGALFRHRNHCDRDRPDGRRRSSRTARPSGAPRLHRQHHSRLERRLLHSGSLFAPRRDHRVNATRGSARSSSPSRRRPSAADAAPLITKPVTIDGTTRRERRATVQG